MTEVIVAQRMWQRRDSAANWTSKNPVLAAGEIGVELGATLSDPQRFKVGNGVTAWNALPYPEGLSGVEEVVGQVDVIVVDSSDPSRPVVRLAAALLARINSSLLEVRAGANVEIDSSNALRPVISAVAPDNPLYPQITDQDLDPLIGQDGNPIRANVAKLPLPTMTLAEANSAFFDDGDFALITDLNGGREPCWYDAQVTSGSKWRRFSDRTQAN